jgi:type III restriction enzyme
MLQRVMPDLMGMKNILVINDEAHHCYREKPGDPDDDDEPEGRRQEGSREEQRGRPPVDLRPGSREPQAGRRRVFDLSATPFFLRGSGYAEGTLFPWTMSDFSLMDAIECGIVKLPRVPVAENIPGDEMPMFRNLWEHIRKMPKKGRGARRGNSTRSSCPPAADGAGSALRPLREDLRTVGEGGHQVPPCFIVVCQNTAISKLVYDYISGFHRTNDDGTTPSRNGRLPLFRNFDETTGNPAPAPNTLLIDSEQLEAGDALDDNFRKMAADEIERFRREIVERTGDAQAGRQHHRPGPAARGDEHRRQARPARRRHPLRRLGLDADRGLGRQHRHPRLGIRAFGTQLLCEQVIGRALRRQSYDLNEDGLFNVEYADVLRHPVRLHGQAGGGAPRSRARPSR